jgi:hypothetical protein
VCESSAPCSPAMFVCIRSTRLLRKGTVTCVGVWVWGACGVRVGCVCGVRVGCVCGVCGVRVGGIKMVMGEEVEIVK